MPTSLTLVMLAKIPVAGIEVFRAYEAAVLPLLTRHGGTLERRMTTADGTSEMHIVSFETSAQFEMYRAEPERLAHARLLKNSGAEIEIFEMKDFR